MKKRAISCLVLLAMAITLLPYAALAETSNYKEIDISAAANGRLYLDGECDWSSLGATPTDYLVYQGNTERHLAIASDSLSAQLTDGVLTANGVPYAISMQKTIGIRNGVAETVYLPMDGAFCKEIYFLACASYETDTISDAFKVTLQYADGSVQTADGFSIENSYLDANGTDLPSNLVAQTEVYRCLGTGLSFKLQSAKCMGIFSYQFTTDSEKEIDSIAFSNGSDNDVKILAVTADTLSDTEVWDKLESKLAQLFAAIEESDAYFQSVQGIIASYEALGGDVIGIPGYAAYKKAYMDFYEQETYTMFDLGKNANAAMYISGDPREVVYTTAKNYDYVAYSNGTPKYRALKKESVNELCTDGVLTTKNGIPFHLPEEQMKGIAVEAFSGNGGITSVSLPVTSGYYQEISFLATTGVNDNDHTAVVTVHYADGTSTSFTQEIACGNSFDANAANSDLAEFVAAPLAYRPAWPDYDSYWTEAFPQSLFAYSFAISDTKRVSSITFDSFSNNTSYRVLAVSAKDTKLAAQKEMVEAEIAAGFLDGERLKAIKDSVDHLLENGYTSAEIAGYDQFMDAYSKCVYIQSSEVSADAEYVNVTVTFMNPVAAASLDKILLKKDKRKVDFELRKTEGNGGVTAVTLWFPHQFDFESEYILTIPAGLTSAADEAYTLSTAFQMSFIVDAPFRVAAAEGTIKDGVVTVNATIENSGIKESQSYACMVCIYCDNEMVGCVADAGELEYGKSKTLSGAYAVPDDCGKPVIRIFVYDRYQNMQKLYPVQTIQVQSAQ